MGSAAPSLELLRTELEALGGGKLRQDAQTLEEYGCDASHAVAPAPLAVFFPESRRGLRELLLWANRRRVSLVPSGGRTGLSGGACAGNGELVVSLARLNRIRDFDPLGRIVECEPGVTTAQLQEFAREEQLYYPMRFGSDNASHIGGNVATNAGGVRVIRYGHTRRWVNALQVLSGDGQLLGGRGLLHKDNAGFFPERLFIGSEGTLGFIVRAFMLLTDPPAPRWALLLALPRAEDLGRAFTAARAAVVLELCEFFTEQALEYGRAVRGDAHPCTPAPYYLLLQCTDLGEGRDKLLALATRGMKEGWVRDAVVAEDGARVERLCRLRENIPLGLAHLRPHKYDLAVPIPRITPFLEEAEAWLARHYGELVALWFGHFGDGGLHLNLLPPANHNPPDFQALSEGLFRIVDRHHGSISAEHGIGLLRRDFLHHTRNPTEIAAMGALKKVLDPQGIMNPGKLLAPLESSRRSPGTAVQQKGAA